MSRLAGRIAVVTGAGRGIGRAHALALAAGGARVVVNDLGVNIAGEGAHGGPAEAVCQEIRAAGGEAVPSGHDVSHWDEARDLIAHAVNAFGGLDILVNNAGILRDRALFNMSEREWDAVVAVHLKGHAAPSRHALTWWRAEAKAGRPRRASVIHTTSSSGLCGNFGQANYGAAKMGVVGLSRVLSIEGFPYGVRSNVISPSARTRMVAGMTGADQLGGPDETGYDPFGPEHIANLVAWLAETDCPARNQVFHVSGRRVRVLELPRIAFEASSDRDLTPSALAEALAEKLVDPLDAFDLILGG
ncbi:SDR family NAD(P)-dependent oxidoreductase [Candidatus Palauibacter sp.]|uniref:SDR family NAD(P)-dependent oxidoreductase n=1 Tax=Candidatus Palauibacter sp. TaxID=3101350 RepID=UPI003B0237C9